MAPQVFIKNGKPLEFCLIGLTQELYDSAKKIESLGGCVKFNETEGIIILTSEVHTEDTPRYNIKYLDDCLREGKLLDLSQYRLDVPSYFRGEAHNESPEIETKEEKVFPAPLATPPIELETSADLTARKRLHTVENGQESAEEVLESASKRFKSSPIFDRSSPHEPEDPGSCNSDDTVIIRSDETRTSVTNTSNNAISAVDRTLKLSDEELKALSQQLETVNRLSGDALSLNANRSDNSERSLPDTDETLLLSVDEVLRACRTKIEKASSPRQSVTPSPQQFESIDDDVMVVEPDPSEIRPPPELVTLDVSDDETQYSPQSQINTSGKDEPPPHCPSSNLNSSCRSQLSSRNTSTLSLPSNVCDKERSIQSTATKCTSPSFYSTPNNHRKPKRSHRFSNSSSSDEDRRSPKKQACSSPNKNHLTGQTSITNFVTRQSPVASTSKTSGNSQRPKAVNMHYMGMMFVEANPPTSDSESDDSDSAFPPRRNIPGNINTSPRLRDDVSLPRRNDADSINKPRPALSEQALRQSIASMKSHPPPTVVAPPKPDNAGSVNRSPLLPGEASPPRLDIRHVHRSQSPVRRSPGENVARNVNRSPSQAGPSHGQRPRENRNNRRRMYSSDSDTSVADEPPAREREPRENGNNRARILPKEEDMDSDEDPENVRPPTREELEDFSWLFSKNGDWEFAVRRLRQRLSERRDDLKQKKFNAWEQQGMLWYLIKNNAAGAARAEPIWRNMIDDGYLRHRTPSSLLNNFMKSIKKHLNQYGMPLPIRGLFHYTNK